ncbi:MAG: hypothetical protein PF488_03320 [Patescibacteria group bacterium]|jgi:hypothetical protein|nr:hypothetical protein [Patescibacteria group bacterium]
MLKKLLFLVIITSFLFIGINYAKAENSLSFSKSESSYSGRDLEAGEKNVQLLKFVVKGENDEKIRIDMLSFFSEGSSVDFSNYLENVRISNFNNENLSESMSFDYNIAEFRGLDINIDPDGQRILNLLADVKEDLPSEIDSFRMYLIPNHVHAVIDSNNDIINNITGDVRGNYFDIGIEEEVDTEEGNSNGRIDDEEDNEEELDEAEEKNEEAEEVLEEEEEKLEHERERIEEEKERIEEGKERIQEEKERIEEQERERIEEEDSDNELAEYRKSSKDLASGQVDNLLAEINQLRNRVKEQETEIKYLKGLTSELSKIGEKMKSAINTFITYGVDDNTQKLGAGERAAVINSYEAAFDKLPGNEDELNDVIKIANGRWPSITNTSAENEAKDEFENIYKRESNMNNANDNAAVTIMAYGLRQRAENRNLQSESAGINTFKNIYNRIPEDTEDWNILQAITYSGATR